MLVNKLKNKINANRKKKLISKYRNQLSFDINQSIIISGVPRGGSSWFAEVVNTLPGSAVLWEPLHLKYYPIFKDLNFKWRQYIDENNTDPTIKSTFDKLLSGNNLTPGVVKKTDMQDLISADYLIVKFCRANRMLPWLTTTYSFKKVIHLLRHPCAVVASQLKYGAWNDVGNSFTEEELKPDGFIENYYEILKKVDSPEKKLAAMWCLDNLIPLSYSNKRWVTIYYEELMRSPKTELDKIDLPFPSQTIENITKPSSTTKDGSPITDNNVEKQLSYWKETLSDVQIQNILNLVMEFNIKVYNENIFPNTDN